MKIGVLGTGMVGQAIASKLVSLGHEVKMGSRSANNERGRTWVQLAGTDATLGTFAESAAFGEVVFNCAKGEAALEVLHSAGKDALKGKVLIDISNPLDTSKGMPPSLAVCNTDSLAEQIQRAFPQTRVVKTLNTVNASLMVNPAQLANGEHDIFMSGNDVAAKAQVTEILRDWFGWKHVVDLGDITTARGTEAYLLLWVRMWGAFKSPGFNVHVVK
ncbi:MAG: NAD(P)-binding domain-containing protein [Myxococcaceae bacterium]|nr:NAD(P)-binding domain-containing protein [Myxococcaceae bacterium]